MFIIFDTETTGLPQDPDAPVSDLSNWPRMVQLAWEIHDIKGKLISGENYIVKPDGYNIPFSAEKVHGISTERALDEGYDLKYVLEKFTEALEKSSVVIGHSVDFDLKIVGSEYYRTGKENKLAHLRHICTKETTTDFCAFPGGKGGKFKWPALTELYKKLFNEDLEEAHNASADVAATARCFLELIRIGIYNAGFLHISESELKAFHKANPDLIQAIEFDKESVFRENKSVKKTSHQDKGISDKANLNDKIPFTHVHVHTQYSILDGAADIKRLITKAKEDNMVALAITDHGNMFGIKEFHNEAIKQGIKPILGCEAYVAKRTMFDKSDKTDGGGFHLILLAKNLEGYHNLVKLVSRGWTEGFYYKPRIDKNLLKKHNKGLIASSSCLKGEIPYVIRHENYEAARKVIEEYKEIYGDDFYLELMRHPSGDPQIDKEVYNDQVFVNEQLIKLSKETGTKIIATNDVHFINEEDAPAHDRLLCIHTGKDVDDQNRLRYTRQEWFKSQAEMKKLFSDIPQAIINTQEIVEKVENYELNGPPVMPDFEIPEGCRDEDDSLRIF